jgi:hypothetical protein
MWGQFVKYGMTVPFALHPFHFTDHKYPYSSFITAEFLRSVCKRLGAFTAVKLTSDIHAASIFRVK